jgi:predicted ABC-type transport system involved in lysophospholipase L1 biosynthesis ATPase subunit
VSSVEPAARGDAGRAGAQGVALGYEPPPGRGERRVWIPLGGSRSAGAMSELQSKRLVSAVLEVRPEADTRLVLLGVDVDGLRPAGREALRDRIAFLPADGGLLSNLNAWENIVLPIGFHHPGRLPGVAAQVRGMLEALGADPRDLLAKLPERMTPYEKKLTGYVRIALDNPDLVLAEEPQGGLDSAERAAAARFPTVYLERCPGGTFVQLEVAGEL